MIKTLGPGKFYGSSLPRPRFHSPIGDRVDPPVPVLDPLMSWAEEAHWSAGGVSFERHRLNGRIEGNIEKLRGESESENLEKNSPAKASPPPAPVSPFTPPAPMALKRKKRFIIDESEDQNESEIEHKRCFVRKLVDDFDRVAEEMSGGGAVTARTRSQRNKEAVVNKVNCKGNNKSKVGSAATPSARRTSPRLLKRM